MPTQNEVDYTIQSSFKLQISHILDINNVVE